MRFELFSPEMELDEKLIDEECAWLHRYFGEAPKVITLSSDVYDQFLSRIHPSSFVKFPESLSGEKQELEDVVTSVGEVKIYKQDSSCNFLRRYEFGTLHLAVCKGGI